MCKIKLSPKQQEIASLKKNGKKFAQNSLINGVYWLIARQLSFSINPVG